MKKPGLDPKAYRESLPGVGQEGEGSENQVRPHEPVPASRRASDLSGSFQRLLATATSVDVSCSPVDSRRPLTPLGHPSSPRITDPSQREY
jgi:hypothetical protein